MHTNRIDWQSKVTREITTGKEAGNPYATLINSQSVLEVCGPDAEKFLQGQCSADIDGLTENQSAAGCICTVKGRVLCTFIATRIGDRLLLKMSAELITPMCEYLGRYAAFFKVELIEWPTPCILDASNSQAFQTTTTALNYKLNKKEFFEYLVEEEHLSSMIEELEHSNTTLVSEEYWGDQQIDCGWLNLTRETSEKYLPHQLNLERLNAISFSKGCYTGQEIIARTEYRGKPKRRMYLIELAGSNTGALIETIEFPKDIIDSETDKTLGILLAVNSTGQKALAILPVQDQGENQGNTIVNIEGASFSLAVPEQPYPAEKS